MSVNKWIDKLNVISTYNGAGQCHQKRPSDDSATAPIKRENIQAGKARYRGHML